MLFFTINAKVIYLIEIIIRIQIFFTNSQHPITTFPTVCTSTANYYVQLIIFSLSYDFF